MTSAKGLVNLVHLYPREMSIYGDLGNTRCLATRVRRHGYDVVVLNARPSAHSITTRTWSSAAGGRTPGSPGSRTTSRPSVTGCAGWPPTGYR